jgi:hypothetical protein
MADRAPITNPVVHVVMADGALLEATCANSDLVAFDITRPLRKWPAMQDAPVLYQTFIAWKALTRESQTNLSWEAFVTNAVQVTTTKPEGGPDTADVDPTQPDHGSG